MFNILNLSNSCLSERGRGLRVQARRHQRGGCPAAFPGQGSPLCAGDGGGGQLGQLQPRGLLHPGPGECKQRGGKSIGEHNGIIVKHEIRSSLHNFCFCLSKSFHPVTRFPPPTGDLSVVRLPEQPLREDEVHSGGQRHPRQ